jgi:hypothetical protein
VLIENAHHGPPLSKELRGASIELISTYPGRTSESGRPGKLERATKLLNKLEKGEVFLPRFNNQWLPELEAEWLAWTGLEDETSDQIDAAAYAARHAEGNCSVMRLDHDPVAFMRETAEMFWGHRSGVFLSWNAATDVVTADAYQDSLSPGATAVLTCS